jgi:hypothetical protein
MLLKGTAMTLPWGKGKFIENLNFDSGFPTEI